MMIVNMEKTDEIVENREDITTPSKLIMYNDEVNSFETVIIALMKHLGHDPHQSEQLAMIAHTKGKAVVKQGSSEELFLPMALLTSENLTVEIQ